MKKLCVSLIIISLCLSFALTASAKDIKAAFVYVGPVGDGGWSYAHDQGRKELDKMGVKTAFVEAVPEGAEAGRVITQFAAEGYDIVFTTSYGYMDTTIEVAKKFPKVVFGHCSGEKRDTNVFTYFGRIYQPMYLEGIIGGKMTKTNKIGYVAPHPIPEVIRHVNAVTIGARSVNPDASVHVVWTGAWYDPAKEKEAAVALMDAGCDIIVTEGDSPAAAQAAEARGKYAFGYNSDAKNLAPKAVLTSAVWDWLVIYKDVIQKLESGFKGWKNVDYWDGMETGTIMLTPFNDAVPEDIQKMIKNKIELFKERDDVFAGPLKDQNGVLKVDKGKVMTDEEIWNMAWFVEGVVGTVPK